jgi:hypothetical protein
MFPTDVCEFHTPKMRPFLPLPNQLATTVTTLGQPVDWKAPPKIWGANVMIYVGKYFLDLVRKFFGKNAATDTWTQSYQTRFSQCYTNL